MKHFKLIYALLLAVALPLLTACYNDDNIIEKETNDGKVTVRLRISQAGAAVTRAEGDNEGLKDPNATSDELMNVWTVVVADNNGNVKHILTCEPGEGEHEIDPIETEIELTAGTYHFYSFANIEASFLETLLDFSSGTIPVPEGTTVQSSSHTGIKFPATDKKLDDYTAKINGNFFNPAANDNGLGAKGIPMSNMQTIEVKEAGDEAQLIDLIVVRLLAKIELQIYNDKGTELKIESITLTDITQNASDNNEKANLKLFPRYTVGKDEGYPGANEKVDYEHGDIQPNLTNDAQKDDLTITSSTQGVTVSPSNPSNLSDPSDLLAPLCTIPAANSYNEGKGTPTKITFYVNESEKPKGKNWGQTGGEVQQFNHHLLKIKINGEELRYALIDDNGTKENEKWDYIARNDYRIIPIVLDDYKLDIIPYDFPAIGVYPASVKEEDGIYTINFHDYGHFHLLPVVTRYSAPTDYVSFTSTTPAAPYTNTTWGLVNNRFEDSWKSWTDATKATTYENATGEFYRNQTADTDGDEAGGEPVWYANTSSPQWQPNATIGYQPFIFGYIADPGNTVTEDKKVYHEFTINLHKDGSDAARQMTYRLYMILDTEQMLYSRSLGAPAARHTHGH